MKSIEMHSRIEEQQIPQILSFVLRSIWDFGKNMKEKTDPMSSSSYAWRLRSNLVLDLPTSLRATPLPHQEGDEIRIGEGGG